MNENVNTAIVRARVNPEIKAAAEARLEEMGLTISEVIRVLMAQLAAGKSIPLELPGSVKSLQHQK